MLTTIMSRAKGTAFHRLGTTEGRPYVERLEKKITLVPIQARRCRSPPPASARAAHCSKVVSQRQGSGIRNSSGNIIQEDRYICALGLSRPRYMPEFTIRLEQHLPYINLA